MIPLWSGWYFEIYCPLFYFFWQLLSTVFASYLQPSGRPCLLKQHHFSANMFSGEWETIFVVVGLYFSYFIVYSLALLLKASSDIDSKGTTRNIYCLQERKALQNWYPTLVTSTCWSWIMLPLKATVMALILSSQTHLSSSMNMHSVKES